MKLVVGSDHAGFPMKAGILAQAYAARALRECGVSLAGDLILESVVGEEVMDHECGVTATVNASVQPILDRYLRTLADELRSRGFANDLLVMNDSKVIPARLRGLNERSGNRGVDLLMNTHHHGDHTGGNMAFKGIAKKFSEVAKGHLGVEKELVLTPLMHDTPAELAQAIGVKDWKKGECDLVPGKTAPAMTVIEPSYSVRVTRRASCSQVMRRPCESSALPAAPWLELRKMVTPAPGLHR